MIISFDLDDLLIPGVKIFSTERKNLIQKFLGIEAIRLGTVELFRNLQGAGHHIYIYTTSFRSPMRIRVMFLFYQISVKKIINQRLHNEVLREQRNRTSKYPPAFNIDIHIDDSLGVKIEGERYNFATVIIDENYNAWQETVLEAIRNYNK
jgi:hypothetical protein